MVGVLKTVLMVLGGVLLVLLVFVGVLLKNEPKPAQVTVTAPIAPAAAAPTVQKEPLVKKAEDIYITTVKQLEQDYKANEIATDKTIAGRQVLLSGRVHAIEKDFMNDPVLALVASNPYMPARMGMVRAAADDLAKVQRGDQQTVLCDRVGLLVGMVTGSSCRLAIVTKSNGP